ncbi:hypothetical protein RKD18_008215 [Streptomyces phaeoluteigriseus]
MGPLAAHSSRSERPPAGPLYASLRPLLALRHLLRSLRSGEPLYGQQARACCLPGRLARGRSCAQHSTCHGPIFPCSTLADLRA